LQENEAKKSPEKSRNMARPPTKKKAKKSKLTDLDLDNRTDSESDEYKAPSEASDQEEDAESMSEDEYLPEPRRFVFNWSNGQFIAIFRGRSGRGENYFSRTRSDDEFIDDSDSDYAEPKKRKGRAPPNRGGKKAKRGKRGKR
jgi:hypothetical protein